MLVGIAKNWRHPNHSLAEGLINTLICYSHKKLPILSSGKKELMGALYIEVNQSPKRKEEYGAMAFIYS